MAPRIDRAQPAGPSVRLISVVAAVFMAFVLSNTNANEAQAALVSMDEASRNETLARVVREAGMNCRSVVKSLYQGIAPQSRVAMWSARCSGVPEKDVVVLVYPDDDGSTGITTCEAIAKIVPCWVKLTPSRPQ